MRNIFNSFLICFSMYSVIPLPYREWKKESMKYIFIFFPLIGLVIGLVEILWFKASVYFGIGGLFYSCIASSIPVILSGGIHLDGFADTCDAWASKAPKEKKAEILKDPQVGAFAVIYTVVFFIILFGAFGEFYDKKGAVAALFAAFVLSRALGGLASLLLPPYKKSGMLFAFSGSAEKKVVIGFLFVYIAAVFVLLFLFVSFVIFLVFAAVLILGFLLFKVFCIKSFGGMSGDLAGFLISSMECVFIVAAAFSGGCL